MRHIVYAIDSSGPYPLPVGDIKKC